MIIIDYLIINKEIFYYIKYMQFMLIVSIFLNAFGAFSKIKNLIFFNNQILENFTKLENRLLEYENKNNEMENVQKIFYNGQIFDAYSFVIDIIESAENQIIIIDNYADKSVLKMLTKKKKNVNAIIVTSNACKISKSDRIKFNSQYPSLKLDKSKKFHDRFIIIDGKDLYHCGASLKDLGQKCFAITKMQNSEFISKFKY